MSAASAEQLNDDESRIKVTAQTTLSNIVTFTKDLRRNKFSLCKPSVINEFCKKYIINIIAVINEFCKKAFPLMMDIKISMKKLFEKLNAWPPRRGKTDRLKDFIRDLKKDPTKFFPYATEQLKDEVKMMCESIWESRCQICHFKKILRQVEDQKKMLDLFEKLQRKLVGELSA